MESSGRNDGGLLEEVVKSNHAGWNNFTGAAVLKFGFKGAKNGYFSMNDFSHHEQILKRNVTREGTMVPVWNLIDITI